MTCNCSGLHGVVGSQWSISLGKNRRSWSQPEEGATGGVVVLKPIHEFLDTPLIKRWSNPLSLNIASLCGMLVMNGLWWQRCSVTFEARLRRYSSFPRLPCWKLLPLDFRDLTPLLYKDPISHPQNGSSVCGWA